jgi:hypothetical protein
MSNYVVRELQELVGRRTRRPRVGDRHRRVPSDRRAGDRRAGVADLETSADMAWGVSALPSGLSVPNTPIVQRSSR